LPPDDWLALYISNARTPWLPMLMPLPRDGKTALLPTNVPVLVLQMRHGRIVAVSDPITMGADGSSVAQPFPAAPDNTRTIVTWVTFPDEARKPADYWTKLPPPTIRLVTPSGQQFNAIIAPGPGFGADGALLVFRNVPLATATIKIDGRLWTSNQVTVDAGPAGLTTTSGGLTIRPAAALTVRWFPDNSSRFASTNDCLTVNADSQRDSKVLVRLLSCEALRPESSVDNIDISKCNVVARPALDEVRSTATFTGVPPNTYVLQSQRPPHKPQRKVVTLATAGESSETVQFQGYRVLGRVTLRHEPVHVRLEFASGAVTSDSTGQYDGNLTEPPRNLPVRIIRCEDKSLLYTYLPSAPILENQPNDIDIPENHVDIQVLDQDGQPVENAALQLGAFAVKDSDDGDFIGEIPQTDAKGRTAVENVSTDRQLIACAVHKEYQRACSSRFTVTEDGTATVTVRLTRKGLHRGVVVYGPLSWGRLYFVRADGTVSEWVPVAQDGTFTYHSEHSPPEYIVLASSAPLLVTPLRQVENGELRIEFPSAGHVIDIEVALGRHLGQEDARLGLVIGGRYVPEAAYGMHQSARGLQPNLYHRGPLRIPEILMNESLVTVMLGPPPNVLPPGVAEGVDIFTLPAYASRFPQQNVTSTGKVNF